MFSPYLPTRIPASTIPMMWGILSLPMIMGAKRMMRSTTKKINVGSVIGKYWAIFIIGFLLFISYVERGIPASTITPLLSFLSAKLRIILERAKFLPSYPFIVEIFL
jgi:hypothetical protein